MRDQLVFEASLVGAIPRSLQEDAELLARFGELVLEREEVVLPGVPHRGPPRRQHNRKAQRQKGSRGVTGEIEIAAHQDTAGLSQEKDRRAAPVRVHPDRASVGSDELVVAENEIGTTRYGVRIVCVNRHLQTERLAVLARVRGARGVRRDQQRGGSGPTHEPERTFAEWRCVDEEVPALLVVDDVLPFVLEGLVELKDPRAELMNIHGAGLS